MVVTIWWKHNWGPHNLNSSLIICKNSLVLDQKTCEFPSNSKFYDPLLLFVDEKKKRSQDQHTFLLCLSTIYFCFGLKCSLTLRYRYSLTCHILATIPALLGKIVTDRVTHLWTTPVPRTIILNTILALSKLQGFPCKVRNPFSWRFVYLAVSKGKGLLCEPFAWNL